MSLETTSPEAAGIGKCCRSAFRRSISRRARDVRDTFERLSQNDGANGVALCLLVKLHLFAGGLVSVGRSVCRLRLYAPAMGECSAEV